ncbi:GntR family transcriptional regulator [Caballeronia arationis]|jgi:GntR family transcriptional regulator|uniref:GntR family transcriptional regulator n=1 Tax=Caballeronia arationis TaxID=1777142 RepID=A0A7Z7IFA3_9BURK|nr:GntR family transcriptional regulator [Caballeronia arationis]SAK63016.1 GntR family transcriptional regulator [Caballeronia arationis]SOE88821.1 GntR family transcriptional regulator [Caballeronia arationis]
MSTMTEMPTALGGTRYKEVKSAVLGALAAQEWKGGEAIPSEKRLAERFGVSIGTLRKAIDELCAENILVRHQGLGTFVAMHQRDRHFFRFFRIVRRDGDKTYPVVSLVNFRRTKASRDVAARLQIAEGTRVFQFTNMLALHDAVVIVESIVLPETRFAGLTEAALRDRPNTLYNFYQDAFGINVVGTDERVRVAQASELEGKLLGLATAAPVLEVERVAYSYHHQPVEYRISHVNTLEYDYVSSYARPTDGS